MLYSLFPLRFDYLRIMPFGLRKLLFHRPEKGNYCNICGNHPAFWMWRGRKNKAIEQWGIVGAGRRKSDCCICGSTDRDRLVFQCITDNLVAWKENWSAQTHEIRVLHIAPEAALSQAIQRYMATIFPHHRLIYLRADKFEKGYFYNKRKVGYLDLDKPFNLMDYKTNRTSELVNNEFHLILANHVLEHVRDLDFSIQQLQGQMAAKAKLLITLPIGEKLDQTIEITTLFPEFNQLSGRKQSKLATKLLGQWDHRRLMGRDVKAHLPAFQAYTSTHPTMGINSNEKVLIINNKAY